MNMFKRVLLISSVLLVWRYDLRIWHFYCLINVVGFEWKGEVDCENSKLIQDWRTVLGESIRIEMKDGRRNIYIVRRVSKGMGGTLYFKPTDIVWVKGPTIKEGGHDVHDNWFAHSILEVMEQK